MSHPTHHPGSDHDNTIFPSGKGEVRLSTKDIHVDGRWESHKSPPQAHPHSDLYLSELDVQETYADEKYTPLDEKNKCIAILKKLKDSDESNSHCADCDADNPEWASLHFGIFLCLRCAGYHRSFGTHITVVRSITLDDWTLDQVMMMQAGGNTKYWDYLRAMKLLQQYHMPEVLYYT